MAKARTRTTRGGAAGGRSTRAKSKKPAAAEVEIVEEEGGANIDTLICGITTVCMIVAILLIDKIQGMYDNGLFM